MNGEWTPWLVVLILLLFVAMFCGLTLLMGRLGGWTALAEHYASQRPFEGRRWRFRSVQLGAMCNYGNCVTVGANAHGLYLDVAPIFRPGHPPLLLPWSDMTAQEHRFLWLRSVRLTMRRVPNRSITLGWKLAGDIQTEIGTVFQLLPKAAAAHRT